MTQSLDCFLGKCGTTVLVFFPMFGSGCCAQHGAKRLPDMRTARQKLQLLKQHWQKTMHTGT